MWLLISPAAIYVNRLWWFYDYGTNLPLKDHKGSRTVNAQHGTSTSHENTRIQNTGRCLVLQRRRVPKSECSSFGCSCTSLCQFWTWLFLFSSCDISNLLANCSSCLHVRPKHTFHFGSYATVMRACLTSKVHLTDAGPQDFCTLTTGSVTKTQFWTKPPLNHLLPIYLTCRADKPPHRKKI